MYNEYMEKHMYQAVIVDDEKEILETTKKLLSDTFNQKNVPVAFDFYTDSEAFLSMLEQHFHYDMLFLDIEMPGLDGITLCRRIRQIAPDALVIFISNKEELVFQTFEVQPFRLIRKSELKELCPSLVEAVITELGRRAPKLLRITDASGDMLSIDLRTILYAEAQRKECRIVTTGREEIIRYKFMDLERELAPHHFIKTHRSFLVNMAYISRITKTGVILTNGEELPISRGSSDDLKQQFITYSMP